MLESSGRWLATSAKVLKRPRLRGTSASLLVGDQHVADIKSRWVRTDLIGAVKVRDTTVIFTDGVEWSIATEPPDEPPPSRRRLGRVRPGRHRVDDRVVRVRDDRQRVLAMATWPDQDTLREKMETTPTSPVSDVTVFERLIERLTRAEWVVAVSVGDENHWLVPVKIPDRVGYEIWLGDILAITRGFKTTTLAPNGSVPMEAALLCWQVIEGDLYSGGG